MKKNLEKQIVSVIYGHGRGWAFSQKDFSPLGQPETVDRSLSRLAQKGTVRRIARGLYDYPKFSKLLDQELPPDIDEAAHALARKFGWTIQVSGNAALNILGLDTQVPTQYLYLSDGPSKAYSIAGQTLQFKKAKLTHLGFKYPESALLVQAINTLGQQPLTRAQQQAVWRYLSTNGTLNQTTVDRVLKDTQYVTAWIYATIKQLLPRSSEQPEKGGGAP